MSDSGGVQARWRADSREIYFLAPDRMLMAVPVNGSGAGFDVGRPVGLFSTQVLPEANKAQYAVSRDGRFLLNEIVESTTIAPITLLLNWKAKP